MAPDLTRRARRERPLPGGTNQQTNSIPPLSLKPIGWVTAGRPRDQQETLWEEQEAEITIDPALGDGLDGIEGFTHVWVIWWLDRNGSRPASLRVHPEGRLELPEVGVFATRSPRRPNPIALTAVRLVRRDGGRLRVKGLDAYEGTAILDVKPYLRRGDLCQEVQVPEWLERLWQMQDAERST